LHERLAHFVGVAQARRDDEAPGDVLREQGEEEVALLLKFE
jgi:hypothetical protein